MKNKLLILIPTYQRPGSLYHSLKSVLSQDTKNIPLQKEILVLNSDPLYEEAVHFSVNSCIKDVSLNNFTKLNIINISKVDRKKPSLLLWYELIRKKTSCGDVVIIHGDDDIMIKDSLASRVNLSLRSDLPLLISKYSSGLRFGDNTGEIFLPTHFNFRRKRSNLIQKASSKNLVLYSLPFISVYSFRIGKIFWSIFKKSLLLAKNTPLKSNQKFLFLPFYIGLMGSMEKQLGFANNIDVIRGQVFKKRLFLPPITVTQKDSRSIVNLCGLYVLRSYFLKNHYKKYVKITRLFEEHTKSLVLSLFIDIKDVKLSEAINILKFSDLKLSRIFLSPTLILKNLKVIFEILFNFENTGIFFKGWGQSYDNATFWECWKKSFLNEK